MSGSVDPWTSVASDANGRVHISFHTEPPTTNPGEPTSGRAYVTGPFDWDRETRHARFMASQFDLSTFPHPSADEMVASASLDVIDGCRSADGWRDMSSTGKGDPLAPVRGLSYDDTLRAIDEALRQ